jgi:hypothetical protein
MQQPNDLNSYLARFGVGNDNAQRGGMVAHISGREAAILQALGGSGGRNPADGLPMFDDGDSGGGGGADVGNGGGSDNHVGDGGPLPSVVPPAPAAPTAPTWGSPGTNIGALSPVDLLLADNGASGHYYKGADNSYYRRANDAGNNDAIGSPLSYNDILGLDRSGAESLASQAATNRGLDPTAYKSLFDTEIDKILGQQPQFATDLRSPFGTDFGNSVLDTEQNRQRTNYSNAADSAFDPNFASSKVPDTFDDNVVDKILGDQFGSAKSVLDNSHARGNLNDIGYNSGLNELSNQRSKAFSGLQSAGGSVLSGYRDTLNNIGTEAKTRAGGYQLGQNFDLNSFTGRANDAMTGFGNTLEGDVRNVAPSNLFDTSKILGRAGSAQGAQNEGRGLFDILASRNAAANQRGLGSQGAF